MHPNCDFLQLQWNYYCPTIDPSQEDQEKFQTTIQPVIVSFEKWKNDPEMTLYKSLWMMIHDVGFGLHFTSVS